MRSEALLPCCYQLQIRRMAPAANTFPGFAGLILPILPPSMKQKPRDIHCYRVYSPLDR